MLILAMILFFTLIAALFDKVFKWNVLHIVIGVGTFGLALAFAGNDLVNFIGVPMAAYHSYEAWTVSGVAANEFSMNVLSEKVPTEPMLLFIAGGIMVLTLWFSKKARTVADTSINLSRQGDAEEKFKPNALSKKVVKGSSNLATALGKVLPDSFNKRIESSFSNEEIKVSPEKAKELPAFDLIRASINLAVAGILISIATSMKLPLSTTYVTFMVAMGTSLADKAWGRESAVYRVAGVFKVIGGWFATAIVAFTAAAVLTYLIYMGKGPAIAVLLIVASFLVIRNYIHHKRSVKRKVNFRTLRKSASKTVQGMVDESAENISLSISRTREIYSNVVMGIEDYDIQSLKKAKDSVSKFEEEVEELRNHLFYFIKNLNETSVRGSNFYIMVLANLTDIAQSLEYIVRKSHKHVDNNHKHLSTGQLLDFREVQRSLEDLLADAEAAFKSKNFVSLEKCLNKKDDLLELLSEKINKQISRTRQDEESPRNTTLYFNLLIETKNLVNDIIKLVKEYYYSASEHEK
jgi:phosphate/sulfate permease